MNRYWEELKKADREHLLDITGKYDENISQAQTETLFDIIAENADTAFGSEHHFSEIHSIEDFRKNCPVTEYEDYRDYVRRMTEGAEDLLFPGRTSFFDVTSGTTGEPKYIPCSERGEAAEEMVIRLRSMARARELRRLVPKATAPGAKVFAIFNAATIQMTSAGIPVGLSSGKSVSSSAKSPLLVVPPEIVSSEEISAEAMNYVNVLLSVTSRYVTGTILNNVAHFNILWENFNENIEAFLSDMRNGTISCELPGDIRELVMKNHKADPERAEELSKLYEEKGSLLVKDVWKDFCYVSCWLAGSVGRFAEEYAYMFPEGTVFFDWGYGASEGKFNIPFRAGSSAGYPATFGYFFEFRDKDGKVLLLEETEDGGQYELIVTSYSGFYRYNIHDLVQIGADDDGRKTLFFVCKTSDSVTIGDTTLYAGQVIDMVRAFESKYPPNFLHVFQAKAVCESGSEPDALFMYVEPRGAFDREAFFEFAAEQLRKLGVKLSGVEVMAKGFGEQAMDMKLSKTTLNTKVQIFIKE